MAEARDERMSASEMQSKVHVNVFVKLLHAVTECELREIKQYLKCSGHLSERENDKVKDVESLWEILNRRGVVCRMKYAKLKQMLSDLHLNFLVDFIDELEEEYEGNKDAELLYDMAPGRRGDRSSASSFNQEDAPVPDQFCSLCFYRQQTKTKALCECSDCDKLTLCPQCCDEHERKFTHCVVPLGEGRELCVKHDDLPRLLKYRCVDCKEFICDVCLVIDHEEHSTFRLSAAGKGALVNTPKGAELTKFLLEALVPDFTNVQSEANDILQEISGKGTELIQEVLLQYTQQMKSASAQRDRLVHAIQAATDCMDVAMTLNRNNLEGAQACSKDALTLLENKRKIFPLYMGFSKPDTISMGRLCQAEDDEGDFKFEFEEPTTTRGKPPVYARVEKTKKRNSHEEHVYETPNPHPSPTYQELVAQGVKPLHAVRRSNSRSESDAIKVRPRRQSLAKVKAIPSMNLYRGINGYQLEDCGGTSWDFLPKFRFAFSLALISDTRHAFLTSNSANPLRDLADTIIIFNTDGSSQNVITENVKGSRRMIINDRTGEIVLLKVDPPSILTLQGTEGEGGPKVVDIPEMKEPTSIDVDEEENYYIIHGGHRAAKLSVLDDEGAQVTSIPIGDHRYVNYAGDNFIFTLSRTSISSYEWHGNQLSLRKTGRHGVDNFEIYGSCCNGFGDLFIVGWVTTTEKPREICLYQVLDGEEEEDEWRLLRLDSGSAMRCNQEPRISYWNGHIVIAVKESMKTCCSRRFKLGTIRRKSITVYDEAMLYDDTKLPPTGRTGP